MHPPLHTVTSENYCIPANSLLEPHGPAARASRTCCSVQPAIACASPMRFNCSTTASSRGLGDGGRLPLVGATTNDASKIANQLPAPAAARAALKRLWRAAAAQDLKADNTCVRRGAARDKRWSCYSTVATDAPNRQAQRPTHNSASNTSAIDATFP